MAVLEQVLYSTLIGASELTSVLGTYNGAPAVFNRQAPDDEAPGWDSPTSPRVDFWINFFNDPERGVEGNISLDVNIPLEMGTLPTVDTDDIEKIINNLLSNRFMETTDRGVVALVWHRTDPAQYHKMNPHAAVDKWIKSITMEFDIMGFPEQPLGEPNPIDALLAVTKREILGDDGAFYVNGVSSGVDTWRPLTNKPAIYWRAISRDIVSASGNDLTYMIEIKGHIMTAAVADRFRYCSIIQDGLKRLSAIPMADGSNMQLVSASGRLPVVFGANSLTNGQITLWGKYRVAYSSSPPVPILEEVVTSATTLRVGTSYSQY